VGGIAQRDASLADYEGLVGKTAELFARQLHMEYEDLKQELWIKVLRAKRAFDPRRSSSSERAFIYGCVANFMKDCRKLAARRSVLRVEHIEDHLLLTEDDYVLSGAFELRYMHMSEDEAFALLDEFALPPSICDGERTIVGLLVIGYGNQEIADILGVGKTEVAASVKNVREKLTPPIPEEVIPSKAPVAVAA